MIIDYHQPNKTEELQSTTSRYYLDCKECLRGVEYLLSKYLAGGFLCVNQTRYLSGQVWRWVL